MKKIILSLATLVAMCATMYAQNGNVGIGTATPGVKLQVVGGIAGGTSFGVSGAMPQNTMYVEIGANASLPVPGANGQILFVKNTNTSPVTLSRGAAGNLYDSYSQTNIASLNMPGLSHKMFIGYIQGASNGWIGQMTEDAGSFWSPVGNAGTTPAANFLGTTDNQDLVVRTNNTEKMRVQAGGNVGIGAPIPHNKLDMGPDVTGKKLAIYNDAAGNDFYGLGLSGGFMQFHVGAAPADAADMTLNSVGNLGLSVGTTSPTNKLTVAGNASVGSGYSAIAAPANGAIIQGNVGIATSAPTTTLDVNGNARIRTIPQASTTTVAKPLFADPNGVVTYAPPAGYGEVRYNLVSGITAGNTGTILAIPNAVSIYKCFIRYGVGCGNDCIVEFYVNISSLRSIEGLSGNINGATGEPSFSQTGPENISVTWPGGVGSCGQPTDFNYTVNLVVSGGNVNINLTNNGTTTDNYHILMQRLF